MKTKSFTLIEVFLVIALIAIIAAVSFPRITMTMRNIEFKNFVDKAYLLLDYAKTHSVISNKILKVSFDFEKNKVLLWRKAGADEEDDEILQQVDIPLMVTLRLEQEEISFFPDGTLQEFSFIIADNEGREAGLLSQGFDGKIILNWPK